MTSQIRWASTLRDGTNKRVDIPDQSGRQDVMDQPAEPSAPDDSSATGDTEEYEILYDYQSGY